MTNSANTSLPEYMIGNLGVKTPFSQKFYVQVGDTPRHTISLAPSNCYVTVKAILPDTSDPTYTALRNFYRALYLSEL